MRYLVRHADAGDKRAWTGPDDDRPLSIAGIVSSPAVRCLQTVQPLAERRRLAIRTDAALTVDADVDLAVALLLYPRADDVVLCTHGELIGPMLDRLRGLGAPLGDGASWPQGIGLGAGGGGWSGHHGHLSPAAPDRRPPLTRSVPSPQCRAARGGGRRARTRRRMESPGAPGKRVAATRPELQRVATGVARRTDGRADLVRVPAHAGVHPALRVGHGVPARSLLRNAGVIRDRHEHADRAGLAAPPVVPAAPEATGGQCRQPARS